MRVVSIAASDIEGGAARAAYRLHKGLVRLGHDASMIVKSKRSDDPTVHSVGWVPTSSQCEELDKLNLIQQNHIDKQRTPISNTYFSLGYPGCDLSGHPLVKSADIIHLHWVSGFQSAFSIARLHALRKRLVWTLHDQRPFTGGCHFSAGCAGYKECCASCPQLKEDSFRLTEANLADLRAILPLEHLTIVAPSRWLADCARQSALFRKSRIETIPYAVETDVFTPTPKAEARRKLELDPEKTYLLFGADYGSEIRKGFGPMIQALVHCLLEPVFKQRVQRGEIMILCFGNPNPAAASLPIPFRSLGYLASDEQLSLVYSAADVFLLPSLEDNFPNTMLEAMSCGTPVAGFAAGGIPELVATGVTGKLVPAGNTPQFGEAILSLLGSPGEEAMLRHNCRRLVERDFSLATQAGNYLRLYKELLSEDGNSLIQTATPEDAGISVVPLITRIGPRLQRLDAHRLAPDEKRGGLLSSFRRWIRPWS